MPCAASREIMTPLKITSFFLLGTVLSSGLPMPAFADSCASAGANSITVSETTQCALDAGDSLTIGSAGGITLNGSGVTNAPVYSVSDGALGDIINNGHIENTAGAGANYGMTFVEQTVDGTSFNHNITVNSITNNGTIVAPRGVYLNSTIINGDFTNNGTITTSNFVGIYVVDDTRLTGNFINNGTINAVGSAFNTTSAPGNGTPDLQGKVENYGTMLGSTVAVGTGSGVNIQGGIYNYAGAKMIGAVSAATSNLTNSGTFYNKINGSASTPQSVGDATTSSVNTFTQTSGGILNIAAVDTVTAGTDYSKLAATGDVHVGGGIFVDVKSGFTLSDNTLSDVITSGGTLTDTITSVTDNSLRYVFEKVKNGNAIDLVVTDLGAAPLSQNAAPSQQEMAKVIEGTSALSSNFDSLGSAGAIRAAVNEAAPLLSGGTNAAIQNAVAGTDRAVQTRLNTLTGISSGDELPTGALWVKPFGSWASQGDRGGVSGYKTNTRGLVIGGDAEVLDDSHAGAAVTYSHSDVSSNSNLAPQNADIENWQLTAYGSHSLAPDLEASFKADFGLNNVNGRREMPSLGLTAQSDYEASYFHAGGNLAKIYSLTRQTQFTPSAGLDYSRIHSNAYTETGAGTMNLSVGKNTTEELVWSADARVAHRLSAATMLEATLGVGYDSIGDASSVSANFTGGGAAFTVNGLKPSPWLGRGGAKVTTQTYGDTEVSLNYDAEVRKNFNNQTASVKLKWRF
ncbi:MAG: autotransporter domain-containing protein [Proteobacteria bacterium]|nr:autotransporter domain-containing protein [Pseudomonadota bacterium]